MPDLFRPQAYEVPALAELPARLESALQRRLGQVQEARRSYERALGLTNQPSEQRFLRSRCAQLPVA